MILNMQRQVEQVLDLFRVVLVRAFLIACFHASVKKYRILALYTTKLLLHMHMSVPMVGWVNLAFVSQVRIDSVQRPVKGESHYPVGVTSPVFGCLEIGKR